MAFHFIKADRIPGDEFDLLIDEYMPEDHHKGWVPAYKYHLVTPGTKDVIGTIDLRIGDQESIYFGGHIGYSVEETYWSKGYVEKACLMLKPIVLAHGRKWVYITCSPASIPSRKTIEKLGAKFLETITLPPHHDKGQQADKQILVFKWELGEIVSKFPG